MLESLQAGVVDRGDVTGMLEVHHAILKVLADNLTAPPAMVTILDHQVDTEIPLLLMH